jgi:hypothetical protein
MLEQETGDKFLLIQGFFLILLIGKTKYLKILIIIDVTIISFASYQSIDVYSNVWTTQGRTGILIRGTQRISISIGGLII